MTSFVRRQLVFRFSYANGDQLEVTNLRAEVSITNAGGAMMGTASARIYGMTESQMNSLATLGIKVGAGKNNGLTILAGDFGATPATVFEGTIFNAWVDYNAQPMVALNVAAQAGLLQQLSPATASSYNGAVDVATIMSDLAGQMGLTLENNGVSVTLTDQYLPGTPRQQALAAARAANIDMIIDRGVLAISPKGKGRPGDAVEINATTGMIGYPTYTQIGLMVRTLFNQAISPMGKVQVTSTQKPATGAWIVTSMSHTLESEKPDGGAWFSDLQLTSPQFYGGAS